MKIDGARKSPVTNVNPRSAMTLMPRLVAREVGAEERAEEHEEHHDPVLELEGDGRGDRHRAFAGLQRDGGACIQRDEPADGGNDDAHREEEINAPHERQDAGARDGREGLGSASLERAVVLHDEVLWAEPAPHRRNIRSWGGESTGESERGHGREERDVRADRVRQSGITGQQGPTEPEHPEREREPADREPRDARERLPREGAGGDGEGEHIDERGWRKPGPPCPRDAEDDHEERADEHRHHAHHERRAPQGSAPRAICINRRTTSASAPPTASPPIAKVTPARP